MATVADRIGEVKGKSNSYKTAYLRAVSCIGWEHFVLGYTKSTGICSVLVFSPYCPDGEYGTCYLNEISRLQADPDFTVKPSKEVRRASW